MKGRILSFSHKWPKLHLELPVSERPEFTSFRSFYWQEGWPVQIFYKSRSKKREKLGEAVIMKIESRELDKWITEKGFNDFLLVTDAEAQEDGFENFDEMVKFMKKQYGILDWMPVMAKLTLHWTS